jgi:hypothetical protein
MQHTAIERCESKAVGKPEVPRRAPPSPTVLVRPSIDRFSGLALRVEALAKWRCLDTSAFLIPNPVLSTQHGFLRVACHPPGMPRQADSIGEKFGRVQNCRLHGYDDNFHFQPVVNATKITLKTGGVLQKPPRITDETYIKGQGRGSVSVSRRGLHRSDDRFPATPRLIRLRDLPHARKLMRQTNQESSITVL